MNYFQLDDVIGLLPAVPLLSSYLVNLKLFIAAIYVPVHMYDES